VLVCVCVKRVRSITGDDPFNVNLIESKKKFARKAVLQLNVLEDYNVVVSLADGFVWLHEVITRHQNHIHTE